MGVADDLGLIVLLHVPGSDRLAAAHSLVLLQTFCELDADGQDRVQRSHGILKNHGHIVAPDLAYFFIR